MKEQVLYFLCFAFLMSCDKFDSTVNIELPPHQPRLVATALFANNMDKIFVFVSKTYPLNSQDDELKPLEQATVMLSNANRELFFTYNPDSKRYVSENIDWDYEVGTDFELEISFPELKTIRATQKVLPKPEVENAIFELEGTIDSEGNKIDRLNFDLLDDPDEENYYSVTLFKFVRDSITIRLSDGRDSMILHEGYVPFGLRQENQIDGSEFGNIFTDATFNGKKIRIYFAAQSYYYFGDGKFEYLNLQVSSISRDLYLYYLTSSRYSNTIDNPFAEPENIYSNFENGVGIFGMSTVDTFPVLVK